MHRALSHLACWTLTIVSLTGCGTFSSGGDKEAASLQLQIGTSQLQGGNYPQALTSLLKAESLDADNPVIQNNLGLAYFVRDRYQDADRHIRKAVQLKPDYSDAHNNLGRVLIEEGKYKEAVMELQKVVNDLTYTTPEKPLINLGMVYFKVKRYDQAKAYFIRAIDIQKDNCLANSYLGRSFYEQKNFQKASDQLDRAAGFCQRSQFDEPQYYSALSFYEMGRRDKAISRLEELRKVYPNGKYLDRSKTMLDMMKR